MKRLLLVLAVCIIPLALHADDSDRALLLAPNGTVYTVESKANDFSSNALSSVRYLMLTIQTQTGAPPIKANIPETLTGGNNWLPALAFDSESDTLFVFWLHSANSILAANELRFCSFQNGRWNVASSIEDVPYHFRSNVRVGMTRTVEADDQGTGKRQVPALSIHVAWWDESGLQENARYAMLSVDKGVVTDVYSRDLTDFVNNANLRRFDLDEKSREMLRHPVIFESPEHDTVDVVFGDMQYNLIHRLTLKPVLQTRVRIPIGIRDTSYPAPRQQIGSDANLSAISTPPDRLVFYYTTGGAVKYLKFEQGVWSAEKSIAVTSEVSAESAVAALRRMVRGD